jgi:hypothetical protein
MSKALTVQEGGDHYKRMKIQPLAYIMENELPFIEGAVVKYVSRWRLKGGVQDLRKARHLLDVLIEAQEGPEEILALTASEPADAAPEPAPAIKQAFGLGAAPEGRAPGPEIPMSWADRPKEPQPIPDWPFDYRPRAIAVPASRTYANADGPIFRLAQKGDQILIYHDEYGWTWRQIRDVSATMIGRRYNVSTDGISVSILMVPAEHVMCIKTKEGKYLGSNDRTA